jgi:hypothetical protein
MPGISLTAVENDLQDIVPLWRFLVTLPDIKDWQGNSVTTPQPMRIQKFTISMQTISDESEPIAQWAKHFATTSTVDSASLTMIESGAPSNAYESLTYWQAWMSLIQDVNGDFGLPSDYWQTIKIYSLDTTGAVLCRFDVIEAFPLHPGTYDFDAMSSSEAMSQVNLACTRVDFTKTSSYP